jgi:nucleotide sugar dehydrogenase
MAAESTRRVAVVGLGKIGLPLATVYANAGALVTGCDVNYDIVDAVNRGECHIVGEPGLAAAVSRAHKDERLSATTETSDAVRQSDVVVIIVPLSLDAARRPDYRNLDAATEAVGRGLRPGTLIVLETTVPVGTTRGRVRRRLMAASGLHGEHDFLLANSPERVSSGSVLRDLATYPKVVGGIDAASGQAAEAFYRDVLGTEVRVVGNPETSEFSKLAESVYRDVNIALANELAQTADALGIDYREAAGAANTQPYSHLLDPGLGVGGHCIPVYPYFLMDQREQPLIGLGRRINDSMARYGVDLLDAALREEMGSGVRDKTVLILGVSYRGGVKEPSLSSTLLVAEALEERGAQPLVHDPLFTDDELVELGLEPSPLPPTRPIDAAVLQAMHGEYAALDLRDLGASTRVFLDGRRGFDRARVEAAGLRYIAIGGGR